jgi:hypothetical protein
VIGDSILKSRLSERVRYDIRYKQLWLSDWVLVSLLVIFLTPNTDRLGILGRDLTVEEY